MQIFGQANLLTFLSKAVKDTGRLGPRLLYDRYILRRQILSTPSVICAEESEFEIHIQICRRDWLNGIWSIKSLAKQIEQPFRLIVFLDHSIGTQALACWQRHLPEFIISQGTVLGMSDFDRFEKNTPP